MKKVIIRFSILSGLAALGYGIYRYYHYQITQVMNYCYKLTNAKLINAKNDNITIQLFLKIENKSSFAVNLKGYDLNLLINKVKVANVISSNPQLLVDNGVSDFTVQISFNPGEFFKSSDLKDLILKFLVDKSRVIIDVEGKFNANLNFLPVKLPVNLSMTLSELLSSAKSTEKKKTVCNL